MVIIIIPFKIQNIRSSYIDKYIKKIELVATISCLNNINIENKYINRVKIRDQIRVRLGN